MSAYASLVRCEACGAPNAAVTTSCSTCGAPRVQRGGTDGTYARQLPPNPVSVPRPNIMTASEPSPGGIFRGSSPSVDSFAIGSSASAPRFQHQSAPSDRAPPLSHQFPPRSSQARTVLSDGGNALFTPSIGNPSERLLSEMYPLIGAGDDGKYTDSQVKQLLDVIDASQRYGREIEQSVEELAELLRKKTVECDGLRALAQENHDPLRRAVRQEYDARIKQESRHTQEQRKLMQQIETLKNERTQMQQELESLRQLLKELQSVPPAIDYNRNSNSLLNHMLRSDVDPNNLDGARSSLQDAIRGVSTASWMMPTDPAMLLPAQRDFINYLTSLPPAHARTLQASGVFQFMRLLCRRLCAPLPDGTFPELGIVVGELLREIRSGGDIAAQADAPIPTLQPSWRQKVTQLYLANYPMNGQQLALLLDEYQGREEELFKQIKKDVEAQNAPAFDEVDDTSSQSIQQRLGYRSALEAKVGASTIQPNARTNSVEERELHARCIIMYKKYNPSKAMSREVQEMLRKYPPEVLLAALVEKYGPEPTAVERKHLVRSLMEDAERTGGGAS